MVDIKDDAIIIGDDLCIGVTPGGVSNELLCSFNNGMIALYDLQMQRFVKNWQLNIADKLTTPAHYDTTKGRFKAIKNHNELIEWTNETEWASDFTVTQLKFSVHSFLTTPMLSLLVYENGCMELLEPERKILTKGRNTNVVQVLYCQLYHMIVMSQLISQCRYHFTFYNIDEDQQKAHELNTTCDLVTDTLGDLVTMETCGSFLLTAWSSGMIVRSKLDCVDSFSLDHCLVTLETSLTGLACINAECFTLSTTTTNELRVYSVQYGSLQCTSVISQDISNSRKTTFWNGYIFAHLLTGLCGCPLVINGQLSLAEAVGKRKRDTQLLSYQWTTEQETVTSNEDGLSELRGLIKASDQEWSTDVRFLSQLTSVVETLLNEEVWPRKELVNVLKAGVFPVNLIPSLLEKSLKQTDWVLLVTVLKYTEGLPEESLVKLLIAVLELKDDSIVKLSKKQTITKSELLCLVLSRYKNNIQLQQPLTSLSDNHVLVLLKFLAEKLDDSTLTATVSPSSTITLSYNDALEWFGLILDTHFTRLIMVPHIRPLLMELKQRFYRHSRYLSYLGIIGQIVNIGKSMTRDKQCDTWWNYKVERINLTL